MSKSTVTELVQADFRKLQQLIADKTGKAYTLDYIRKVCKGKRNNPVIKEMAEQYTRIVWEMNNKLNNLSK